MAVKLILGCEHLMPLGFTEKSLKEDLMERLGNIISHLSNGYKNMPKRFTLIHTFVLNSHALCRITHSFTSSMYRLEITLISICKSSPIRHEHSLASKFIVGISFLLAPDESVEPSDCFFERENVLQFISSQETAGAKIVVL